MTETQESTNIATLRLVNRSAIHTHALKCAKATGRGRFTRVSESFIDSVQAEIESLLHEINRKWQPPVHPVVAMEPETVFISGAMLTKARDVLNEATARIIQAKVQRHPSSGKTLMS